MTDSFGNATEPVPLRSSAAGQEATHGRRDAEIDGLIAATHARIAASQAHLESLRRRLTQGRAFMDASLWDMNARRSALDDRAEGSPHATR